MRTNKLGVLVGVVALVFGAAACGDDDGGSANYREELVTLFTEDDEFTEEQANCVVDELEDSVGAERLEELAAETDLELEPPAEVEAAAFAAVMACVDFDEMLGDLDMGDLDMDEITGDIDLDEMMGDLESDLDD